MIVQRYLERQVSISDGRARRLHLRINNLSIINVISPLRVTWLMPDGNTSRFFDTHNYPNHVKVHLINIYH